MFFENGHIAWLCFLLIVFTALFVLVFDWVWRMVQTSARTIGLIAVVVWLAGAGLLFVLLSG